MCQNPISRLQESSEPAILFARCFPSHAVSLLRLGQKGPPKLHREFHILRLLYREEPEDDLTDEEDQGRSAEATPFLKASALRRCSSTHGSSSKECSIWPAAGLRVREKLDCVKYIPLLTCANTVQRTRRHHARSGAQHCEPSNEREPCSTAYEPRTLDFPCSLRRYAVKITSCVASF